MSFDNSRHWGSAQKSASGLSPADAQRCLDELRMQVKQLRAVSARREFCDTECLRHACHEAALQRGISQRALAALRRVALLADARGDHELRVMADQGFPVPGNMAAPGSKGE
jgi:hypothetical protein